MTAVGDARKRLDASREAAESRSLIGPDGFTRLASEPNRTQIPASVDGLCLPRHFVATDALGSPVIWRGTGTNDPHAQPVLEGWRVMRDDPDLWAAIVRMVQG